MKAYRYIYTGLLTALLIGWGCLLTGCSDQAEIGTEQPDSPQPEEPKGEPLRVASLTRGVGDTDATADPMKGEYVYLFLAAQGETTKSGSVLYKGKDDTSTGNDIVWASGALYVKPGNDYEVYGFLPADEATGTTAPSILFSGSTVTMTINGLDAVAKKDICVVIGANTVGQTITPGLFGYHAPENTEIGYGVDLLADHLYASAKFQFKVHADYDKLRTIKLKKVELKTASSMYAKVDATITLTKGNANPITNVVLDQDNGSGTVDVELFTDNDAGYELKVDETKDLMIYFDPAYKGDLVLKSTYDVYDKQGHLLRENCTAENGLGSVLSSIVRGKQIVIPLTVQPTYIYILSESDADWNSPTVSFN